MLYLIGLGLDKRDLSLKSLEILRKCDKIYLEIYTSEFPIQNFREEIKKLLKKEILMADREFIENTDEIIKESKKMSIALLVYGDPLSATTHSELILRAKKNNVGCKILHSISVLTAVSNTGLQLYKFGKIASIPKFSKKYRPESFFDILIENKKINAHTLFLLDVNLEFREALSYILEIAKKRKMEREIWDSKIFVCSCLGTKKERIFYSSVKKFLECKKKFKKPMCIIFPSKLHFIEKKFSKNFSYL